MAARTSLVSLGGISIRPADTTNHAATVVLREGLQITGQFHRKSHPPFSAAESPVEICSRHARVRTHATILWPGFLYVASSVFICVGPSNQHCLFFRIRDFLLD